MKLAVVALMVFSMAGCDAIPGKSKEVSTSCINHANAIATDAELEMMRTGYAEVSERLLNIEKCGYYFFNPDAKTDTSEYLAKENKDQCEAYRLKFHEAALQLKQQALSICLSMK